MDCSKPTRWVNEQPAGSPHSELFDLVFVVDQRFELGSVPHVQLGQKVWPHILRNKSIRSRARVEKAASQRSELHREASRKLSPTIPSERSAPRNCSEVFRSGWKDLCLWRSTACSVGLPAESPKPALLQISHHVGAAGCPARRPVLTPRAAGRGNRRLQRS